jgi:hypothetical protein
LRRGFGQTARYFLRPFIEGARLFGFTSDRIDGLAHDFSFRRVGAA